MCVSNQGQLVRCASSFALTHRTEAYIPTANAAEDSFGYLYPEYLDNPQATICPSTRHRVRPDVYMADPLAQQKFGRPMLLDLHDNGFEGANDAGGHSYEIWAWMDGFHLYPDGFAVYGLWAGNRNQQRGLSPGDPDFAVSGATTTDVLKTMKNLEAPDRVLLLLDGDDTGLPNYPDPTNNHGKDGANMGFADGHASWVPAGPMYIETTIASRNAIGNEQAYHPRIRTRTAVVRGQSLLEYYYVP